MALKSKDNDNPCSRLTKKLFHIHKELSKILKVARAFEVSKWNKKGKNPEDSTIVGLKGLCLKQGAFFILREKVLPSIWEQVSSSLEVASLSEYLEKYLVPAIGMNELQIESSEIIENLAKRNSVSVFINSNRAIKDWSKRIGSDKVARVIELKKQKKIVEAKRKALIEKIDSKSAKASTQFIVFDDDNNNDDENNSADGNAVKKNRMGQRARQQLWEKKYGATANHKKREVEVAKTNPPKPKQNPIQPKNIKSNTIPESEMHPSWRLKKQQKTGIQEFKGTRITFDD